MDDRKVIVEVVGVNGKYRPPKKAETENPIRESAEKETFMEEIVTASPEEDVEADFMEELLKCEAEEADNESGWEPSATEKRLLSKKGLWEPPIHRSRNTPAKPGMSGTYGNHGICRERNFNKTNSYGKHESCEAGGPHTRPYYEDRLSDIGKGNVRRCAEEIGGKEDLEDFFESVLYYFLCEYRKADVYDLEDFFLQTEREITDTILGLPDFHPSKTAYYRFLRQVKESSRYQKGDNGSLLVDIAALCVSEWIERKRIKWEIPCKGNGDIRTGIKGSLIRELIQNI